MAAIPDERIKSAVRKGEEAFWAAIAEEFPEATSGDLDPSMVISLLQTMERAVHAWVDYNVDSDANG